MSTNWTKEEVALIVADYFEMLNAELNHIPYNKLAHRKNLNKFLNDRYNAIEFKHRNISGVLANLGLPYIKGYKPLFNFQKILQDEVLFALENRKVLLEKEFENFAEEIIIPSLKRINFEKIIEKSPKRSVVKEKEPSFRPIKINYLAREQNNRNLGEKGEQLVFDYEKWRLIKEGKENLADRIEWVSKTKGDGLGYDILSKNKNGTDRFIEVKTTKLAKETPIYLSNNELKFSNLKGNDFYLYRVFNFKESPQIFIKKGNYDSFCQLIPQSYRGFF